MSNFEPTMVVLARQSRGLTQTELAERMGVRQGTISKIEQGELAVSSIMLDLLSRELEYPVSFFKESWEIHGPGTKYNRARKSLSKKLREKIDAIHNVIALQLWNMAKDAEYDLHAPSMPAKRYGSPETVAQAVREMWRVPRGPIKNLTKLVEDAGIIIIKHDFETGKWDGVYMNFPNLPPLIFINSRLRGDRYRLTLGHEVGHVFMHREMPLPVKEMDNEANRFAAELLMPREDILPYLKQVDLPRLANQKRLWGTSMQAILVHSYRLGVINERRYRYLWMQIGRAGWSKREPPELDVPLEHPSLKEELVEVCLKDMAYTPEALSQKVHLHVPEFKRLYLTSTPRLRLVK